MKKALFKSVMVLSSTLMLLIPFTGLADDYLYVDVNRDGEVNIADVNAVIAAILGNYDPPLEPASKTFTVNGVSFTMVKVDGGKFWMGGAEDDADAFSDERPLRVVQLSDYYIGQTEVTQELWEAVMGSQPSGFSGSKKPVECVSWDDCKVFIQRLNAITGQQFRLPTEAEWEFAARGGNKNNGYKYAGSNDINEVAWWTGNYGTPSTHPVAQMRPNELGLYDMSGNVFEWCNDWYGTYPSPSLSVSTDLIIFDEIPNCETQFSVSGNQLSHDVFISVEGHGFTVSPQHIGVKEANEGSHRVTVTYTGPQSMKATGKITISSLYAVEKVIDLSYHWPSFEVIADNPIMIENFASPSATFKVVGYNLTGDVTLSIDGDDFSITESSITPDNNGHVDKDITVSFTGQLTPDQKTGEIKVSVSDLPDKTKTITVIAQLNPTLEIVPDGPIMLEDSTSTSANFRVIGHNLIADVALSIEGDGFSINPMSITPDKYGDVNEEVTVTFSDTLSTNPVVGTITIKSIGITKTIEVVAQLKSDPDTPQMSYQLIQIRDNNVGSDYEGYVDVDPHGPSYGSYRIMRGGAWNTLSKFCRVSYRYGRETSFRHSSLGLRLAM